MADVVAYLYVSRYFDQPVISRIQGQQLVRTKGCLTCHSINGKGGKISADFATSKLVGSPASLIAGMWNHSRFMEAQVQKQQIPWPILTGQELADISAYLASISKGGALKPPTK
jgi:mono/diheme cytochrome c family protein